AGGAADVHDVGGDLGGDRRRGDGGAGRFQVGRGRHGAVAGVPQVARVEALCVAVEDVDLVLAGGQRDRQLEEEAVELGLGQRVGALVLDGVLGRGHQEGVGERAGGAVDGDLAFLHGL